MPGLNDFVRRQTEIIERIGWAVMHVLPNRGAASTVAPYSYAVGLTARIAPEFVITGLLPEVAQQLLNDMARSVFHGTGPIAHATRMADLIAGLDAVIIDGAPTGQITPSAAVCSIWRRPGPTATDRLARPERPVPVEHRPRFGPDSQPLIGRR